MASGTVRETIGSPAWAGKVRESGARRELLGFQSMRTAYATLKGFEAMSMFKKRQFDL